MKWSLILLSIVLSACAGFEHNRIDAGADRFTRVAYAAGVSKDELYERALQYLVYNYRDASKAIQYQNKELGKIIVKGVMPATIPMGFGATLDYAYTETIDVRDGYAQMQLTQFRMMTNDKEGPSPQTQRDLDMLRPGAAAKMNAFTKGIQGNL